MPSRRVDATYRLQLGPQLRFDDAAELADYLAALGVTHLYLSPVLQARPGSTHGYDVADPTRVSAELGGEEGLRRLARRAHAAGLGLVVDIVPNHLGTGPDTPLWEELLTQGPGGRGARFFDVDWDPPLPGGGGKVILPVLGEQYGTVVSNRELRFGDAEDGTPRIRYHEHSFPLTAAFDTDWEAGAPPAFGALHAVLEAQHYRLVDWRIGQRLINYRRFFAIDDLAAVRVENPDVFDHTHELILGLVDEGIIDGLRVDHPDGLRDPASYFSRLARRTGGRWTVVEKIVEADEALPDWPVAGTTGYEIARELLGLFIDRDGIAALAAADAALGGGQDFDAVAYTGKREAATVDLRADTDRLAHRLQRIAQRRADARDCDIATCREAIVEVVAALDVYRTYVGADGATTEADLRRLAAARRRAIARAEEVPATLITLIVDIIAGRGPKGPDTDDLGARLQQLAAAVHAKGVEDTALYRWLPLTAANEVGGDPRQPWREPAALHAEMLERAARHPQALSTTATHDTKRGEDTRLRIAALSELGDSWRAAVDDWHRRTAALRIDTPAGPAPNPQSELLAYQTLVGLWPAVRDDPASAGARLGEYLVKARREAGRRTTWTDPDEVFEQAVRDFALAITSPDAVPGFREAVTPIAADANEIAMVAGLAQTVLRVCVPGVPDTYQGCELWDDSLVDPDNRRPVAFDGRRRLLAELDEPGVQPAALLDERGDGRVKLWTLSRALRARAATRDAFGPEATYVPVDIRGQWARHLVSFARVGDEGSVVLVVVPRLPGRIMHAVGAPLRPPVGKDWGDTTLQLPAPLRGHVWRDALTDAGHAERTLQVGKLLATLPVAMLTAESLFSADR